MRYQEALREWGARRLERGRKIEVIRPSVKVDMEFDEGFSSGLLDEGEYDSYAQSPSAMVVISGVDTKGRTVRTEIDYDCFDFAGIVGELVAVGDGALTA